MKTNITLNTPDIIILVILLVLMVLAVRVVVGFFRK